MLPGPVFGYNEDMPLTQPYSPDTPSTMRTTQGEVAVPERMSLAEFEKLDWIEDERWELIEGVPCMSPGGTPEHQLISGYLRSFLFELLSAKGYLVLQDTDIRFPGQESYFRPDLSVFSPDALPDLKQVPIAELPALVVEILSPSTASNDMGVKRDVLARAGVPEYWIADPATGALLIFVDPKDGQYTQLNADSEGRVRSPLLGKGFRISRDGITYRFVE